MSIYHYDWFDQWSGLTFRVEADIEPEDNCMVTHYGRPAEPSYAATIDIISVVVDGVESSGCIAHLLSDEVVESIKEEILEELHAESDFGYE